MINDLYDQLEQAITEAETSKQEAFVESIRRQKAEKEVLDISRKVSVQRFFFLPPVFYLFFTDFLFLFVML